MGFSALEVVVTLVIVGILTAIASKSVARYGTKGRVDYEASRLVDHLWELRTMATTGVQNPCMEFLGDNIRVRLYLEKSLTPDGYTAGTDSSILLYPLSGKIKIQNIVGGNSPRHYVCFQSKGVAGSAMSALEIKMGPNSTLTKTVRLLPSTGIARIK
jgi:prepilin-type N-terminal cleavage/methylation domain-containing protein